MELQNTGGMPPRASSPPRATSCSPRPTPIPSSPQVRLSELPDVADASRSISTSRRLAALGLSAERRQITLSTAWGGRYVNDFIDRGRVKRVYVQGDAPYRSEPEDIDQWYVRNNQGEMVPFSSFAQTGWTTAPASAVPLQRHPGVRDSRARPRPGRARARR